MHASVINGVYDPSPTELCGGWPVYYNNCASKAAESNKNGTGNGNGSGAGGSKVASITTTGVGSGVRGGGIVGLGIGGSGDTAPVPDITKSFLLFCPYAMSWAITVLANFNDPSVSTVDRLALTPSISATAIIPTTTTAAAAVAAATTTTTAVAATTTAAAAVAATAVTTTTTVVNGNDQKTKNGVTGSNEMVFRMQSVFPESLMPHQNTLVPNTDKDGKPFNSAPPHYTPSSAPLTLAFFEVSSNIQPELAHNTATWKVIN